ncbi:hypothetical protein ACKC9G_01815 [Pokkaliibacter sp. CJK22405]|uniref:hypothetical protein n=1 Tax=Pokkaliibacter sp. CJK22405 TaxID=3384615 RepID=UPI0039850E23
MDYRLDPSDRYALQQQYRRAVSLSQRLAEARQARKAASESRWWMLGILCALFAFHSDVFLGGALAFLYVHFFVLFREKMAVNRLQERFEEIEWWFHQHGLVMRNDKLYSERDAKREYPLNPFEESSFS